MYVSGHNSVNIHFRTIGLSTFEPHRASGPKNRFFVVANIKIDFFWTFLGSSVLAGMASQ
jgi:hypothetical protein